MQKNRLDSSHRNASELAGCSAGPDAFFAAALPAIVKQLPRTYGGLWGRGIGGGSEITKIAEPHYPE